MPTELRPVKAFVLEPHGTLFVFDDEDEHWWTADHVRHATSALSRLLDLYAREAERS